ncbi:MAG: chemotaxis response regulator CheY [Termitinemataceae bacterium]|nr:MAG: chemotaxis response regulator CheY [Termitinemataceae bacterium]
MTVLVVDDSPYMRGIVKTYFDEMGQQAEYLEASDGKDALKIIKSKSVDLVFVDWNMPRMTGIDFLKEVRSDEKLKDLPIVMVTSESSKLNVVEAMKSGATDYIVKPIDDVEFKEKITEILNG